MVLVLNPGATSTKFGVFTRENGEVASEWVRSLRHTDEEMAQFRGRTAFAQLDFRAALIAARKPYCIENIAQEEATRLAVTVYIRHAVSDEVIATVYPRAL